MRRGCIDDDIDGDDRESDDDEDDENVSDLADKNVAKAEKCEHFSVGKS